jgi:Uma2 family endonuclease
MTSGEWQVNDGEREAVAPHPIATAPSPLATTHGEPTMPVSEEQFRQIALDDPQGHWELYCGQPRQKPPMTHQHDDCGFYLAVQLANQLERKQFNVRFNAGHVRVPDANYYIPDVFVIPRELFEPLLGTYVLEWYEKPLPLVVEVWSPSTGQYDLNVKLRDYQRRGDLEIWLIHPYDRTLRAWVRQPDGSYVESTYNRGLVQPVALPNVTIDLDALFDIA